MEAFEEMTAKKSAQEIEEEGGALSQMVVIASRDGFYGKIIITLTKAYHSEKNKVPIPEHCKLQVGDDVAVYSGNNIVAEGIIYKRGPEKIKISINSDPE